MASRPIMHFREYLPPKMCHRPFSRYMRPSSSFLSEGTTRNDLEKGKKVGVKGIPRFSVDQTNRVGLCVHLSLAQTIPFYDVEERPAR